MSTGDEHDHQRPVPGEPRPYEFPHTVRDRRSPTACASSSRRWPAASWSRRRWRSGTAPRTSPPSVGGATVLAARGLTEGTEVHDAIALTEAAERLGASIHAEAGWDATSAGLDVPASRLAPAMDAPRRGRAPPVLPRVRDGPPARRAPHGPPPGEGRPAPPRRGGLRLLDLRAVEPVSPPGRRHAPRPSPALDAGGPARRPRPGLRSRPAPRWSWRATSSRRPPRASPRRCSATGPAPRAGATRPSTTRAPWHERFVPRRPSAGRGADRDPHRASGPAAPPPGLPRRVGHEHDPRRPVQLPAEHEPARGEGLHLRRQRGLRPAPGRGPFAARAAVNTEATVPALREFFAELDRIRETPVTDDELAAARDYLVGVFPLRFETPGPVAGSLAGPLRARPAGRRARPVSRGDRGRHGGRRPAGRPGAHPARARPPLCSVGDHDAFGAGLEAAGPRPDRAADADVAARRRGSRAGRRADATSGGRRRTALLRQRPSRRRALGPRTGRLAGVIAPLPALAYPSSAGSSRAR